MSKDLASLAKRVKKLEGVDISKASLDDKLTNYIDGPEGVADLIYDLAPHTDQDWSELETIQDLLGIIPEANLGFGILMENGRRGLARYILNYFFQ